MTPPREQAGPRTAGEAPDHDRAADPAEHSWLRYRRIEHDLDGLVVAAADVIAALDLAQQDARVTVWPDARAVRYYQTLGILDRPLRYDGRQAVYGFRHLLAIVAIKRLQTQGMTLAQVQRALAGATSAELEAALRNAGQQASPDAACPSETATAACPSEPVAAARPLVAAAVAPGVWVTMDPERVSSPDDVLARIRRCLT